MLSFFAQAQSTAVAVVYPQNQNRFDVATRNAIFALEVEITNSCTLGLEITAHPDNRTRNRRAWRHENTLQGRVALFTMASKSVCR